jgi:hypothetical protein
MDMDSGHYELRRVNEMEWIITDRRYHAHDSRRTVARIFEVDTNECEVVWLRDLPFRTVYASALDALGELTAAAPRHTKPIHIPHTPPPDGAVGGSRRPTLPA